MAIDPNKENGAPGYPNRKGSSARWVLGALGLLWLAGLVTGRFRKRSKGVSPHPHDDQGGPARRADHTAPQAAQPVRDHERRDVNAKWIFGIVLSLFVSGIGIHLILAGWLNALKHTPSPADRWHPVQPVRLSEKHPTTFPRLQVSPAIDLKAFREHEDAELNSFGWINRTAGIVRVPISVAMGLVLKEGLPARNQTNQVQTGPSAYELIQGRTLHRETEIQENR